MQVRAAVLEGVDASGKGWKIEFQTLELEPPRPNEVLVRVTSCGVCGTDRGCLHGIEPYPTPGVLGHEGAGIVEDVGQDVTLVARGDRVVMGFPFCGVCRNCRAGQPRYCEVGGKLTFSGYRLDGSTSLKRSNGDSVAGRFFQQSSWATYAVATQQQLARVPEELDTDLMGPLGCSVTTGAGTVLNELRPTPGSSVAIFGCGAVGLSAVMAARLTGCDRIIAIDRHAGRLNLARQLGATDIIPGSDQLGARVLDLSDGGVDYAIEATNGSNLVAEACSSLRQLGVCAMVGGASPRARVELVHTDMLQKGKRLIGVMGGGGQTPAFHVSLMKLQAQGRFPLEKLVQEFPFEQINEAITASDAGTVVKPILRMS
jgi:aryl-alcohol dehydrogenase